MMDFIMNDLDTITFAAVVLGLFIAFFAGFFIGYGEAKYQIGQEVSRLREKLIVTSATLHNYAPRPNREASRWQCPRTGEFVDDKDITRDLAAQYDLPQDTALWPKQWEES